MQRRGSSESSRADARFSYPVFLDLDDSLVLVVGGGRIGARKAAGVIAAGARVRLVAAEVSEHVDVEMIDELRVHRFTVDDLEDVRLVITATGDHRTDQSISAAARERGIWTNAADQPVDCEFILPAIARSGRVTVAVSTDGASPALAQALRDRIASVIDERSAVAADVLAAERAEVQASGGSTEDVDWAPRVAELLAGSGGAASG